MSNTIETDTLLCPQAILKDKILSTNSFFWQFQIIWQVSSARNSTAFGVIY